ncbi:MAG: hypothetical protein COA78_02560 [Blastopirellula sp.]|nr:MAG: hypothetical protein COA78_02560 [Blastopirellula sp.]
MIKLYTGIDNQMKYNEAWIDDDCVVQHFGRIGTKGRTRYHDCNPALSDEDNIFQVLKSAFNKGYQEIDLDNHSIIIIEFQIIGMGSEEDIEKLNRLQDRMNETLGWTGLGMCDGGSVGSDSMEACCFVVEVEVARKVIESDLENTEFANYTRIYEEQR